MRLAFYLKHRTFFEFALVLIVSGLLLLLSVATEVVDFGRSDNGPTPALAWVLEGTSVLGFLLALPVVGWFDRHFPLSIATLKRGVPAHLLFSVVFSALHVAVMYLARVLLFPAVLGSRYHWDDPVGEFLYEYAKDIETYASILAVIYLYRFVILRLQGEAGFLTANEHARPKVLANDRFLVKKLGSEFLVRTEDIEWIESAGNYANLHVDGRVYPLRSTMAKIDEQLSDRGFLRVHRSALVSTSRIAELVSGESGGGTLRLTSGAQVPVSRRYRPRLREVMGAQDEAI